MIESFALDLLVALSDFIEKFHRSGCVMSNSGLSQNMVNRLDQRQSSVAPKCDSVENP